MVSDRLRELLLEGANVGELAGPGTGQGLAEHPVCGDSVQLSVRQHDGTIGEVRWRAAGCPASTAVAALAAKVLVQVRAADAADVLRAAIQAHGGLAAHERHAEAVTLRALAQALGR
jgi:NifU-like protein involved in Fe-S cluster formation